MGDQARGIGRNLRKLGGLGKPLACPDHQQPLACNESGAMGDQARGTDRNLRPLGGMGKPLACPGYQQFLACSESGSRCGTETLHGFFAGAERQKTPWAVEDCGPAIGISVNANKAQRDFVLWWDSIGEKSGSGPSQRCRSSETPLPMAGRNGLHKIDEGLRSCRL